MLAVILPREVEDEFCLPTGIVSMKHIRKIVEIQENSDFKIAPSLSPKHVDPKQFEKMKVNVAAQLLSHSTASALQFAVHDIILPVDALTTAWFVDFINNWFDAANARSRREALYAKCGAKIESLLLMMEIISKITFSSATRQFSWKPIHTGILVSTRSFLDLFASLVASGSYNYLLTSRLTQDALENLFSQIRGRGNCHPSPVHFRHCLRLISVSQFLAVPKRSSYSINMISSFHC
jgi:DNA transposase THAP9